GWVYAVTVATAIAAGSIGSTVALWREKTFQTLALVFLALMFWLAAGEALNVAGAAGLRWLGGPAAAWGPGISPLRAGLHAGAPRPRSGERAVVVWIASHPVLGGHGDHCICGDRGCHLASPNLEPVARDSTPCHGE